MAIGPVELAKRLQAKADWLGPRHTQSTSISDSKWTPISHISLPENADASALSFLFGSQVTIDDVERAELAGAVIVDEANAHRSAKPFIVENPLLALARAHHWLPVLSPPGTRYQNDSQDASQANGEIAQTYLGEESDIPAVQTRIHQSAVVGVETVVGHGTEIGANCSIDNGVTIGSFCTVGANVVIKGPAKIGNRVTIDANCTIGSEPFLFVEDCGSWLKVPGFCGVIVNDDVDIGAGTTLDKGLIGHTSIGRGAKLDSQVHLGHGVKIGKNTVIAARTTVAGESVIGSGCKVGGACAISEGVTMADNVTLLGMSAVTRSLKARGEYTSAWPVQPKREWWKQLATLKSMAKR